MKVTPIKIFGCSFSQNLNATFEGGPINENCFEFEIDGFTFNNFGKQSSSNYKIFNSFETNIKPNDICIIQWSALTRPSEEDHNFVLKNEDNPLYYYLEKWYKVLDKVHEISKEKNITLIQFIGWAQWKDNELNEYHRNKLNSYNITWYKSSETWDRIDSNCFQFQSPSEWSSYAKKHDFLGGTHQTYFCGDLERGGMSEWIRENIEIENRYLGFHHKDTPNLFDSHPSMYANKIFYKKEIIKKLNQIKLI